MALHTPSFKRSEIARARYLSGSNDELVILFGLLSVVQNVVVVSPSKAAKTSLLLRLANPQAQREHRLDPSRFLFCYLDLGGLRQVHQQEFFELMLFGMIRQASRRPALGCLQSVPARCGTAFPRLLSYVEQAEMIGLNLVWMLDEFDAASRNPNLNLNFFSALRALASRPRVALVTATRHTLHRMGETRRPVGSSLAGLFVTIRLKPL